ncbi:hypothetical protein SAMN05216490_4099 [Mucilaginibacter mallensis]|uniref:Uncharacterized protein n=1 Tax=Mucilaginibacter mallensis TaxID=652787 RepID=A0A1H2BG20_MUCMA|nr:hypothetical protein SAMN05216490_4099 [Mucilaginibacter mallensis]
MILVPRASKSFFIIAPSYFTIPIYLLHNLKAHYEKTFCTDNNIFGHFSFS